MVSIVFAGVGGQGLITAANMVGKAAVTEGKNVLMTELHGMAQRGGSILVEVRIGDYKSAIIPLEMADVIVGFEKLETARNLPKLKKGGTILLNERRIHPISLTIKKESYPDLAIEERLKDHNPIKVEADQIALDLDNKRVVNTVMTGALFSTGLLEISEESLHAAIKGSFPEKLWEANFKAFEAGKRLSQVQATRVL